ncbi:hypothetical protein GA0061103_5001 [Rhizobium multihospitium]|uniref:Uncharacterized protein n=1 Tax=Rhizobium multihospitium TaxID=410764 RepID=A0A1C3W7W1_9HYPH|nr:hypothetical protein GA0061103_5001 [Rhizobium multihospitium]
MGIIGPGRPQTLETISKMECRILVQPIVFKADKAMESSNDDNDHRL